jgi:hypothetical protein
MNVGQIRQATTHDAPALLALINRAFAVEKFFVDRDRITARLRRRHIRVVNLREELPPFYHSLGYVETGRGEPVDDPGASKPYHFILMGKPLR